MKKKVIALILAVAMSCLLLTGCGGGGGGLSGSGSGGGGVNVRVLGSGWWKIGSYTYVSTCVELKNNNSKATSLASMATDVKDADGRILYTTSKFLPTIAGGDSFRFTDVISFSNTAIDPAAVHVGVSVPSYGWIDNSSSTVIKSSSMGVSNVSLVHSGYYDRVTGYVVNNSRKTCTMAYVSLILKRNGNVVGGSYNVVTTPISNGSSAAFQINVPPITFDSYEVVAVSYTAS